MSVRTCWRTFIASWGVMAPLVMSSSRESVRAMPTLDGGPVGQAGALQGGVLTKSHGKTRSTQRPWLAVRVWLWATTRERLQLVAGGTVSLK